MSIGTTPKCPDLAGIVHKTVPKQSDCYKVKTRLRSVLQELNFIKKGFRLQLSDPSYKLRYLYAFNFWNERTGEGVNELDWSSANELIQTLREELNSKDCVYGSEYDDESIEIPKGYFSGDDTTAPYGRRRSNLGDSKDKPNWYVASKCEEKLYVKSTNYSEPEKEIFLPIYLTPLNDDYKAVECSYKLICPGDEFQVISSHFGDAQSVNITKSTGLNRNETIDDKARFIKDLLTLFSQGESGLTVVDILRIRFQGIWNHLKNDEELFEDFQCVRNVIKLSLELSRKLSKRSEVSCKWFLQDLSTSLFFTSVLPKFIQSRAKELNGSDDMKTLTSLLELAMHFSPHTATQIWEVAKHLVDVMHTESIEENSAEGNSKCDGVQYLVHLGKILSKSVSGYQDVDITNCRWNELPAIPTEKEILAAFNLRSLDALKLHEPYDSVDQYLGINYRLLREECFRDLCTGIQKFREFQNCDARNMKMYRIKLETVTAYSTQIFLVLNCEDYQHSVEKQEDTSNKVLYGSLMCISLNKKFDSLIWATVVECEPRSYPNVRWISVQLCSDRNKIENIDVLLQLLTITNEGDHALMAESPTFYNAFAPCMDRLRETHEKANMAFERELVYAKKSPPPKYTEDKEQKCDWSIIFDQPQGREFSFPKDQKLSPIEQFKHLQETLDQESSKRLLDETQMMAIENFLKNRVSLIQGPPGTGKSFLGAKILRLMLSMKIHERFDGPILVITNTNFALDHFLRACLEFSPNIVRIGKTGNEDLSKIDLRNILDKKIIRTPMYKEATKKMRTSQSQMKTLFRCLSSISSTLQLFLKAASDHHIRSLLTMSEDSRLNIDNAKANNFLFKLRQNTAPQELKELLNDSLKRWLPNAKIQQRYQDYTMESDSDHYRKNSASSSSLTVMDDEEEDLIDRTVLEQDRQQDAVEAGVVESDDEIDIDFDDLDEDEHLADDTMMPRFNNDDIENVERSLDPNQAPKSKRPASSMGWDYDDVDSIDRNRKQDAEEEFQDDVSECDSGISDTMLLSDAEELLTDDLKIQFFRNSKIDPKEVVEEHLNLWTLSEEKRVDFIYALQSKIIREFTRAVTLYEDNAKIHKDIWDDHTVSILKEYDVIAMTVSGAATRLHLLDELKPCAVIVEEAAEIIEGQLVSVLPPSIQHLVMLGDQEQLKPRINCYQLKKKHLDCSMFERLINNNMNFTQLGQQCRMRDDIADLLGELNIYKDLQTNHQKTCNNKPPDCIGSSLYFVKHTKPESKIKGSNSLYNQGEIDLILGVAEKLMKSGYVPGDVTVLCSYRGQVTMMKTAFDRKSLDPSEKYFARLKDINITTVDSFQGEENKVILLSLVRSNRYQKIGLFAVRNRICVAISRAKCGLYIFGNTTVYGTSGYWKKIIDLLAKKGKVGSSIPFMENATEITTEKAKKITVDGGVIEMDDIIFKAGQGCLDEDTEIFMEKDYQHDVSNSLLGLGLVDAAPRVVKLSPDGLKFKNPVDLTFKFEKTTSDSGRFILHGFYNPMYQRFSWELVTNGVEENDREGVICAKINSLCIYMFILSTRGKLARILSHLNHSFTCRAYAFYRRIHSMDTIDISVVLLSEFLDENEENDIKQLKDHVQEGFVKGEKGMLKRVYTHGDLEMCLDFPGVKSPPYSFQIDQPELDSVGFVIDHFKRIVVNKPANGAVKINHQNGSLWNLNVHEMKEETKAEVAQVLEQSVLPYLLPEEQSASPDLQPDVVNRTQKLTSNEMDQISGQIGIDWDNLAALMDMPYPERDEIRGDWVKYPSLSSKAKRVLELLNDSDCFDRNIVVKYLRELNRYDLEKKLLPMESKDKGEELATSKSQPEIPEIPLRNETPLSSREMHTLSQSLVCHWDGLAPLLGITAAKRDDIRFSLLYTSSHSKAEKVLAIFNHMQDFSRKKLAECLEEIGQSELKKPVVTGEWR